MKRWVVFKAVFRKIYLEMTRYAFNSISGLITIYIVFLLLFFGAKMVGGSAMNTGSSLEGLVVGYVVWVIAMMAYQDPAWRISTEAEIGTLEQSYLSPAGFAWVNISCVLSDLVFNLIMLAVILVAVMLTTGRWLNLDLLSLLPLMLITSAAAYGLGFAMGGLALVYKRIQSSFQILQFVLVAFIIAPIGRLAWVKFLPLALGNDLLRRVMVDGQRLWELPASDIFLATAVGAGYLLLGLGAFAYCVRVARDRGLLGHY